MGLTHWGRVTHICVGKLTIFGSDNGLSPGRRQAIIWTNAGVLLIGPLETNFSEISIAFEAFSFKKMHLKISSAKWRPFCPGLIVLSPSAYMIIGYNLRIGLNLIATEHRLCTVQCNTILHTPHLDKSRLRTHKRYPHPHPLYKRLLWRGLAIW